MAKKPTKATIDVRGTLELLGIWEQLHNTDFDPVEFDGIRKHAGLNTFTLTPMQWIEKTGAIGLVSRAGRYGGTYAHTDGAFPQSDRIKRLNAIAIRQMQTLTARTAGLLEGGSQ